MQVTARKNELLLDKLAVIADVTKKASPDEVESATREGAYAHGFSLEGARWDMNAGTLEEAKMKEMYRPRRPHQGEPAGQARRARHLRVPRLQDAAARPHLRLRRRAEDEAPPAKWVMAGVSMLLDVAE